MHRQKTPVPKIAMLMRITWLLKQHGRVVPPKPVKPPRIVVPPRSISSLFEETETSTLLNNFVQYNNALMELELSRIKDTNQPGENVGIGLISNDITTVMMPNICTRKGTRYLRIRSRGTNQCRLSNNNGST